MPTIDSDTDEQQDHAPQVGLPRRIANGLARLAARFSFLYFLLFAFPFPLTLIPDVSRIPQIWHDSETPADEVNWDLPTWADTAYEKRNELYTDWTNWERDAVDRVAADVFGYEQKLDRPRGSGDPTYGYVQVAGRAGAAIGLALIWSLLAWILGAATGRQGRLIRWLTPWMHVAGRYYLATVLLGYGLAKVYPSQFRFPSFARLETPYGDGSPMNILWSFMGSSTAYIVFAGVMEVLPALLLFFRRTALVGALLGGAVMANVTLLNYCYDVPVKIFSTHLFVLAVALALPDLKRLGSVFLLNRPAPARDLSRPRTGWFGHLFRLAILVPYLGLGADRVIELYKHPTEPHELQGVWDVVSFKVDGEERTPRTDDALRFQSLIVDRATFVHLKTMDGSLRRVEMARNKDGDRITLSTSSTWRYRVEEDEMVLLGEHQRTFQPATSPPYGRPELRDPQMRLRLKKDPGYEPTREIRPRRAKVPEVLRGRWTQLSQDTVGDSYTRRRAVPSGWDAIEIDADGASRVQYELSEHEFKLRASPYEDEPEVESGEMSEPADETEGELTLRSSSKFDVEEVGEGALRLTGELLGTEVEVELRKRDPASFLLVRRGFNWINEIPLNRY